ncbi:DUF406 family protein [Paraferrimonas sp. SM1919]|uniref:DUF406 family protein n=1 Tax=Paraferrimonas sp. SM1919 TaxID=2662263 RepID=UPI0013D442C9|nr:DUF406 family protein [Paraferrimonas sp. SM1919]
MTQNNIVIKDDCTTCGSPVEMGSIIDNQDLDLTIKLEKPDIDSQWQQMSEQLTQRFPEARMKILEHTSHYQVVISFSCGVEKILYQLEMLR